MRNSVVIRLVLYAFALLTLTVTFKWFFTSKTLLPSRPPGARRKPPEHLGELEEFCQPLPTDPQGAEAGLHGDDYRLEAVFLLTRHGQRAPMTPLKRLQLHNSCELKSADDRETFDKFRLCLSRGRIVGQEEFRGFSPLPTDDDCHAGELTKAGVNQMIRLGRWIRRRYAQLFDRPVFNGDVTRAVEAVSTALPRTYQSAVAFLHGLSSSSDSECSGEIGRFRLRPSLSSHFCMEPPCDCAKLPQLHRKFHAEQLGKEEDIGGVMLQGIVRRTLKILGIDEQLESQRLFDLLTGGFLCRNAPLPCDATGACVTADDLQAIYSVLRRRNEEMLTSGSFKTMSVAESLVSLQQIISLIRKLTGDEDSTEVRRRFFLFSGHDISLRPLLRVLEIKDSKQIRYTGRLTVELYRQVMSDKRFLRILYNGQDVGSQVPFCTRWLGFNAAVCPLKEFEEFVQVKMLRGVGASSLRQLCGGS